MKHEKMLLPKCENGWQESYYVNTASNRIFWIIGEFSAGRRIMIIYT